MRRAQLSLSVLEAGVAALLVLAVAGLFVLGPGPPTSDDRLDRHAGDLGTLLVDGDPSVPRLSVILADDERYVRHRGDVADLIRTVLPADVQYRLETDYGTLGAPRPPSATAERTRVLTANGSATIWVWAA
jgi:hypothetical protein